jgi:cobalt transporter subunit CbtB
MEGIPMHASTLTTHGATAGTAVSGRTETLVGAIFAALLGATLIWGVGFSHIMAIHNAAHDVRHSNGFPCH